MLAKVKKFPFTMSPEFSSRKKNGTLARAGSGSSADDAGDWAVSGGAAAIEAAMEGDLSGVCGCWKVCEAGRFGDGEAAGAGEAGDCWLGVGLLVLVALLAG